MAAAAMYMHNLEQAHIAESAAAAGTAKTYRAYIEKLDDAGVSAYALTEGLYDLVKAQEASQQAAYAEALIRSMKDMEMLGKNVRGVNVDIDDFVDRIENSGRELTDYDLKVLQNQEAVVIEEGFGDACDGGGLSKKERGDRGCGDL